MNRLGELTLHSLWALGLALPLAGAALADEGAEALPDNGSIVDSDGNTRAMGEILANWQDVDLRLTALLDELPEQAHAGIQRAIDANRDGREQALQALEGRDGSPDTDLARARADAALTDASTRAASGLDQARAHVPAEVLPRLDEAAARMQAGLARVPSGVGARPALPPAASGRGEAQRPEQPAARPNVQRPGVDRPAAPARPQRPVRPQSQAHRPGR